MRAAFFAPIFMISSSSCTQPMSAAATAYFDVKMTLQDHGVERAATSTWRLTLKRGPSESRVKADESFSAEAIPVQLKDGNWLFFLPISASGEWGSQWIMRAVGILPRKSKDPTYDPIKILSDISSRRTIVDQRDCYQPESKKASGEQFTLCPEVLLSLNPKDQKSFSKSRANSDEGFPPGISNVRISIAISQNRQVSRNIEGIAPWTRQMFGSGATDPKGSIYFLKPNELQYIKIH